MKLGQDVSKRLVQLLYKTASKEVAPKIPYVTKYLYEHQDQPQKSLLDDLMENQWKQQPLEKVLEETALKGFPKSNLLKFKCHNKYISDDDFHNLFPVNRERMYNIDGDRRKTGFEFQTVKSRHPLNLLFEGAYYLVFQNYIEAAVYYMETKGKIVNGIDLKLEFTEVTEHELKHMVSPYVGSEVYNRVSPQNKRTTGKLLLKEFLKYTPTKFGTTTKILKLPKNHPSTLEQFNNYKPLTKLIELNARKCAVLVKNLPFILKRGTVDKLLWDYKLALKEPVLPLILDSARGTSLYLLRFLNPSCAARFVRNFHGKRWDVINQEKKLYEPILCETLE